MIGIIRATWPNLILLYRLNKKNELVRTSVMDIAMYIRTEEKRAKSNEVILIALITIFILSFFARSLVIFLILLAFGLIIGVFGLIKNIR